VAVSGLIGARIEAGEGHKGIGTAEWNSLERVEHTAADDGAHSGDLSSPANMLFGKTLEVKMSLTGSMDKRTASVRIHNSWAAHN
jgi:hypothetical protein